MKCPVCGTYNRASFPKCYRCGAELPKPKKPEVKKEPALKPLSATTQVVVEPEKRQKPDVLQPPSIEDKRSVKQRRDHGKDIQSGLADIEEVAFPVSPVREVLYDQTFDGYDGYEQSQPGLHQSIPSKKSQPGGIRLHKGRAKRSLSRRLLVILSVILLLSSALIATYVFWIKPALIERGVLKQKQSGSVIPSILDDAAAHTITIPAEDGAQIYIKELRKSYTAVDGAVVFQIADHFWYDNIEEDRGREQIYIEDGVEKRRIVDQVLIPPVMDVEITPYYRAASGEQIAMDRITYQINVPQSPLTLIRPDSTYAETNLKQYSLRFKVEPNSRVKINDVDLTAYVNAQEGLVTYNADLGNTGATIFTIEVRSPYYRMTVQNVTLYREPQTIPLEIDGTIDDESSRSQMAIFCRTLPGVKITVLSPHDKLNTEKLATTGEFSFDALFDHYGINTVRIMAEMVNPAVEVEPTILSFDVNYTPNVDEYTRKAWALNDGFGYSDLLANMQKRIDSTQVYVFTGIVEELITDNPQLAIFDAADGKVASPLKVLVENQSKTDWVIGQKYTIYAEAYGVYDSMPRLLGRFTYRKK